MEQLTSHTKIFRDGWVGDIGSSSVRQNKIRVLDSHIRSVEEAHEIQSLKGQKGILSSFSTGTHTQQRDDITVDLSQELLLNLRVDGRDRFINGRSKLGASLVLFGLRAA